MARITRKAPRKIHSMTGGYAPGTGRLLTQIGREAERLDYTTKADENGVYPRVGAGYTVAAALGSQDLAILFLLAAMADAAPSEGFTADELLPYTAVRTVPTLRNKLVALERNGWVKSAKGQEPGDRQTYWWLDI